MRRPRSATRASGLYLLAAGIACTTSKTVPSVVRSTAGETTSVHNNTPVYTDTATLRTVMRIGRLDGPDEYTFLDIDAFTVDRRGVAYVAEDDGPLRSYDAAGRFLATVARVGGGPGEVRNVTGLTATSDGRLIARDGGNARLNVYGPGGEALDHWPLRNTRTEHGQNAVIGTAGDHVHLAINPPLATGADQVIEFPRPAFVRLGADGAALDTVFITERYVEACPVLSDGWFRRGWHEDSRVFYIPKPKWTIGSDGSLIVGCPATYEFDVRRPDGSVLRVSRIWKPLIASTEELDAFKLGLTLESRQIGLEDWSFRGPELPRARPAYDRILTATDGRIWVWPTQPRVPWELPVEAVRSGLPERFWQEPGTGAFDVFEPDGRWLGSVRIPPEWPYTPYPDTPDPFIRGDTIWAVTVDSLEVQYLSRYEVDWP